MEWIKKYGEPHLVTRLILNDFLVQKLKLSSIPNIYDICWWLGIKCTKPGAERASNRFICEKNSEADLVWVAAFVLVSHG